MTTLKLCGCLLIGMTLTACIGPAGSVHQKITPTDAEVEAYNASVSPEERIVCREEVPVGSFIPRRVCRLQAQVDSTSDEIRTELRRVLQ